MYKVTATLLLNTVNHYVPINTTSVLFTQLLPGLSYEIIVIAINVLGIGRASDKVIFRTVPTGKNVDHEMYLGC